MKRRTRKKKRRAKRERKMRRIIVTKTEIGESRKTTRNIVALLSRGAFLWRI